MVALLRFFLRWETRKPSSYPDPSARTKKGEALDLMTAPESPMGSRLFHAESPPTSAAMARYGARLLTRLEN